MHFFHTMPQAQVSNDTRLIINVWYPRINEEAQPSLLAYQKAFNEARNQETLVQAAIGHISMELPALYESNYVSWWPGRALADQGASKTILHEIVGLYKQVPSQNNTYEQDKRDEGSQEQPREPDLRICLYSLNLEEIHQAFQQIENSNDGYVLMGDKAVSRIINFGQRGHSCCDLAYTLLVIGGILKLIPAYKDLTAKWMLVTPPNLAELIRNAKRQELTLYPETQELDEAVALIFAEEEALPSRCVIS